MGIIDRYLLRQFLKTFLICFLSLMGLYVVIECSTNMEEFMRCGEKMGGVLKFIGPYYSYRTFRLFRPHQQHAGADFGDVHGFLDSTSQRTDRIDGGGRFADSRGNAFNCRRRELSVFWPRPIAN